MIQRGERLVTFRVGERIDLPGVREFAAERLADHRLAYLEYEGEVSGGRGVVKRVARGEMEVVRDEAEEFEARGSLGETSGVWVGAREGRGWEFVVTRGPSDCGAAGGLL
jgi:hypothetical protein